MKRTKRLARWIAEREVFLLPPVLLLLLMPTRFTVLGYVLIPLIWLCRWVGHGRLTIRTPMDWPVLLILVMILVSFWATALPQATLVSIGYLVAGVATFYSLVNWARDEGRLRWAAWGVLGNGVVLAAMAPGSVEWPAETKLPFLPGGIHSPLPLPSLGSINPNVIAGALGLLLPLALGMLLFGSKLSSHDRARGRAVQIVMKGLLFLAMLPMLAVLILSKSRGAYMGVVASWGFVLLLRWPRIMAGFMLLAAVGAGYTLHRLGPSTVADALLTTQALGGLDGRLEVWSRALYMLQDFPFTGIGMGTFQQVANLLYPFFLAGPDAGASHAHNLFLQVGVDLGLPGLIAYVALLLTSFWAAGRLAADGRWRGLGVGLLGSLVALGVHGLTDAVTWGTKPAFLSWAVFGLAVAAYNQTVIQK